MTTPIRPLRKLIGHNRGLTLRENVLETADGVEVESRDHYEVTRRRVLFSDVQLITYHRTLGLAFVVMNAVLVVAFIVLGFLARRAEPTTGIVIMAFSLPFLIALILRLAFKVDFVTVFGRRTKAVLRFSFRKRRAREVYEHLIERVRTTQSATAIPLSPTEELPPPE